MMSPPQDDCHAYRAEVERVLPRILAAFDRNPLSSTLGLGDRVFWAWKTQDFANVTPQSAVHGLARLASNGLLPLDISRTSIFERIDEMIEGTRRLIARDGSLEEAFPNEKSFCVTALAAYDILTAADLLDGLVDAPRIARWRQTAAPLVEFIIRNDETHAIISNHLATAVAALTRWKGAGESRARERAHHLLDRIISNQSHEGWYCEYGGADPGYETLGLYYLADVHLRRPELGLAASIERSMEFLTHCAHPDGSFGGLYGARNTRFIVPAGIEALARSMPAAAALARFTRRSIAQRRVVTLSVFDDPNLAPNFNAYCWAAAVAAEAPLPASLPLPCETVRPWRKHFSGARLVIDNGPAHYTIAAPGKGGVVVHFSKPDNAGRIDPGVAGTNNGHLYTTQAVQPADCYALDGDTLRISAVFIAAIDEQPAPIKFLILRLLALTAFQWRPATEFVKRMLVRRLITGQRRAKGVNVREIKLGPNLEIIDTQSPDCDVEIRPQPRSFSTIHMASSGYWQQQDDEA